jgi:hypothetical protein
MESTTLGTLNRSIFAFSLTSGVIAHQEISSLGYSDAIL